MELNRSTSLEEVIEALKQDQGILYNTLPKNKPFVISRKNNAFGAYFFIHQGEKVVISLKCSPDHESQILGRQLVEQALIQLGYEVKTSAEEPSGGSYNKFD